MDLGVLQALFSKRARRIEGMKSRSSILDQSKLIDLSSSCNSPNYPLMTGDVHFVLYYLLLFQL